MFFFPIAIMQVRTASERQKSGTNRSRFRYGHRKKKSQKPHSVVVGVYVNLSRERISLSLLLFQIGLSRNTKSNFRFIALQPVKVSASFSYLVYFIVRVIVVHEARRLLHELLLCVVAHTSGRQRQCLDSIGTAYYYILVYPSRVSPSTPIVGSNFIFDC